MELTLPSVSPGQTGPRQLHFDTAFVVLGEISDLSPVGWVALSPTGILAVGQPRDNGVRFYSVDGQHLRTAGRLGSGPGEFRQIGPHGVSGEGLWVADYAVARVSRFDWEGSLLGTFVLPRPHTPVRFDRWAVRQPILQGKARAGELIFVGSGKKLGDAGEMTRLAFRTNAEATKPVLIAMVQSGACVQRIDAAGQPGEARVPLCVEQMLEVASDGERISSGSWEPIGSDSVRFDLALLEYTGRVVWQWSEQSVWVRPSVSTRDSALEATIGSIPIPAVKLALRRQLRASSRQPPFSRIVVGAGTQVWVEETAAGSGPTWDLVSSSDGPSARVNLPRGFNLRAAGKDILICTVEDANGFENLVALRLHHPP